MKIRSIASSIKVPGVVIARLHQFRCWWGMRVRGSYRCYRERKHIPGRDRSQASRLVYPIEVVICRRCGDWLCDIRVRDTIIERIAADTTRAVHGRGDKMPWDVGYGGPRR